MLPTPPQSPQLKAQNEHRSLEIKSSGDQIPVSRPTASDLNRSNPPSSDALVLLLRTLLHHELQFFASLPDHLVEYLSTLPAYNSYIARQALKTRAVNHAYYLHSYEVVYCVAGLKPCVLLGFGDASTEKEAVDMDDAYIERVWIAAVEELRGKAEETELARGGQITLNSEGKARSGYQHAFLRAP